MADILRYYDYDPEATITCPNCEWTGPGAGNEGYHADLFDICCPTCGAMVLVVSFPTIDETRRAAAAGVSRAIADLPAADAQQERWEQASRSLLTAPDELPDLAGDEIRIDWDFEDRDDEVWTVLSHQGVELWREAAFYEGAERFAEVFEIVHARYGDRLRELRPTEASENYLYGDDFGAPRAVERLNAGLGQE